MLLSASVQSVISPTVMLHRNVIPPCRKKNKDTNRYLIHKIQITYLFFLFLQIQALVMAAYNVYYWVKGDRNGFANSKESAVSELASIQEMPSCAEKLNCWNEIRKRSLTHVNPALLKPCPCVSGKPKSFQELCWWLSGVQDPLTVLRPVPRPWPVPSVDTVWDSDPSHYIKKVNVVSPVRVRLGLRQIILLTCRKWQHKQK